MAQREDVHSIPKKRLLLLLLTTTTSRYEKTKKTYDNLYNLLLFFPFPRLQKEEGKRERETGGGITGGWARKAYTLFDILFSSSYKQTNVKNASSRSLLHGGERKKRGKGCS